MSNKFLDFAGLSYLISKLKERFLGKTDTAASATKLSTARNINGVAFDGTKDITVKDDTKLSLSGGTLNGKLYFSNDAVIGSTADSGVTRIDGGTDYTDGAFLALHGINWKTSANAGAFQLSARDSSGNVKELWGFPNGLLRWSGTFQVTNLVLTNPLSIKRNVNTSYITVYGGTDPNDGARLMLAGSGDSDAGKFRLYAAKSSTENVPLEGSPDGSLKWGGLPVAFFTTANLSSKYFRFNNGIQVCWGLGYYETNATVTYPIAFAENPGIACNSIVRAPTNWSPTGFKMEGNASYAAWIAVGRWA